MKKKRIRNLNALFLDAMPSTDKNGFSVIMKKCIRIFISFIANFLDVQRNIIRAQTWKYMYESIWEYGLLSAINVASNISPNGT